MMRFDWSRRIVVSGGSPVAIPEGEPIPNKTPGDYWITRLGEFDAELEGEPGTMVALYLKVEPAEWLDSEPQWEDKNPYEASLYYCTAHVDQKELESALRCFDTDLSELPEEQRQRVIEEVVAEYGCKAIATSAVASQDNLDDLIQEALIQAQACLGLPGFLLDAPQNRIGNTGWDFIRGRIGFR